MDNFFTNTKNKIQGLFLYIVSCGKSSNELSRNDQGPARDVPLGSNDLGQKVYVPLEVQAGPTSHVPPRRNAQGQGHIVVLGEPTNIPQGKSPIEPSRNDQETTSRDVLEEDDTIIKPYPSATQEENNAQGQDAGVPPPRSKNAHDQDAGVPPPRSKNTQSQGHIIVLQPGNNTQNQTQPTINIEQQGQGVDGNSQEQKQKEEVNDDEDFEPLPEGFVPEERANFSRPPGKRSAPIPKTG